MQLPDPMVFLASPLATLSVPEQQAFRFFTSRRAIGIEQAPCVHICDRLALQMSDAEPTMMSAIVAVGAMHHARASALWNGNLEDVDPGLYNFAMRHYSKSVSHLQAIIDEGDRDATAKSVLVLVACLLFIQFEMLEDCDDLVIQHVRQGSRLLLENVKAAERKDIYSTSTKSPPFSDRSLDAIAAVFIDLDYDCMMLGETKPFLNPRSVQIGLKSLSVDRPMLNSIEQARIHVRDLQIAVYAIKGELVRQAESELESEIDVGAMDADWYYCLAQARSRTIDISANPEIAVQIRNLEEQTHRWLGQSARVDSETCAAKDPSWTILQLRFFMASPSITNTMKDILLTVVFAQIWLQVTTLRNTDEDIFDQKSAFFKLTLHQASRFLGATNEQRNCNSGGRKSLTGFTMTSGVLLPLYHIAIKCRNPTITNEAIALLCKANVQEGVFDSYNLAIYAKQIVELELSEPSSIVEATMCVDLEHLGIGRLVFARRRNCSKLGFELEERHFSIFKTATRLTQL